MSPASRPTTTTSCAPVQPQPIDIDDAGLRRVVADIARRTGFRIDDHRLELFGLCPACQADLTPHGARQAMTSPSPDD